MRMPSYNSNFEDPWFWGIWGRDLFEYSFYQSRYVALHNESDKEQAATFRAKVPDSVVEHWLWRRTRNFNVTMQLLESHAAGAFSDFYITFDDSGTYGFNVQEAARLRAEAVALNVTATVPFYPGADEVGLAMLSRLAIAVEGRKVTARVVWRAGNATGLIPGYESQPIAQTVEDQLHACGVTPTNDSAADLVFMVNNFAVAPQEEASQQGTSAWADYSEFLGKAARTCSGQVVSFADVRYANGGDRSFVTYLLNGTAAAGPDACLAPGRFAYAGWNTDGNTLGTAISNGALLSLTRGSGASVESNKKFTLLRLLEDEVYQSSVRQQLVTFVSEAGGSPLDLAQDLHFYERFSQKLISFAGESYASVLQTPARLGKVFYPWNRTFEIGFDLVGSEAGSVLV